MMGYTPYFPCEISEYFVDYPLGQMHVGDKLWMNWNKAPMRLWQTQLNFTVFCASSVCGVSLAHLTNNKKRSHTQLDSRKQVIAFQDSVITINIKEAQHPLKREKQVIDKSSIMLKISTKSMHRVLV